jgi:zinc transport system substrate-binding protein
MSVQAYLTFRPGFLYNASAVPSDGRSMKRIKNVIVLAMLILWTTDGPPTAQNLQAQGRPKIRIMTTVFPLLEFAREVAGERGEVTLLLPPGAEVHTWQPRVSDIKKFAALDVFIYIGQNLEPWAKDILDSAARPGLRTLEAGRGLPLLPADQGERSHGHEGETLDPHVWLDFGLDQILVDKIAALLKDIEPDNSAVFERAASACKQKLRLLDDQYRETFLGCAQKAFIFGGHAAFGYLARRYGLEQIAVYGLSPDAAPTPKDLAWIITEAKKRGIKTIFFEQSVSDKMARLIAKEIGADTRLLNPGHNLTKEQIEAGTTFIGLMRENLESFKHGLSCR